MSFFRSIPPIIKIILIVAGAVAFISIVSAIISGISRDYGTCNDISIEIGQINNKEGVCYSVNKAALRMSVKNTGTSSIHSFVYIIDGKNGKELILPRSRLGAGKSFELEAEYLRSENPNIRLIPRVETEQGILSCEDKSVFRNNIGNC